MAEPTNIILNKMRFRLIRSFIQDIISTNGGYYVFYGQPFPWPGENDVITSAPMPMKTYKQEVETKRNILAMKRVTGADIALGIKDNPWNIPEGEIGNVYSQYSDVIDLSDIDEDTPYYVITAGLNVFMCLDNAAFVNEDGVLETPPSTESPDDTKLAGSHMTADGYVWHFMYSLNDALLRKFNIENYIPVDVTSDNNQMSIALAKQKPGTVDRIDILAYQTNDLKIYGGEGYSVLYRVAPTEEGIAGAIQELSYIPIFVDGNGDMNATAAIIITSIDAGTGAISIPLESGDNKLNGIVDIPYPENDSADVGYAIISSGSGYTIIDNGDWSPVMIRQESALGNPDFSPAYGIARINAAGEVEALRIIEGGAGYRENEPADVVQSSAIALGQLSIYDNDVSMMKVDVLTPGLNFSVSTAHAIADEYTVPAILQSVVSPPFGHGSDPEIELSALSIIINMRVAYKTVGNDFSIENDFRTVGIIENVLEQDADGVLVTDDDGVVLSHSVSPTLSAKTSLICGAVDNIAQEAITSSAFPADEIIVGSTSGARARIVDVLDGDTIRVINSGDSTNSLQFIVGEEITALNSSRTITSISLPEYVPLSGNILFINNRERIQRDRDQIETFNFIFKL